MHSGIWGSNALYTDQTVTFIFIVQNEYLECCDKCGENKDVLTQSQRRRSVSTAYHTPGLLDEMPVHCMAYAPINSKPQHPPPGIPRAFDCASCPGRGEFERCIEGVGNLNRIYLLF